MTNVIQPTNTEEQPSVPKVLQPAATAYPGGPTKVQDPQQFVTRGACFTCGDANHYAAHCPRKMVGGQNGNVEAQEQGTLQPGVDSSGRPMQYDMHGNQVIHKINVEQLTPYY